MRDISERLKENEERAGNAERAVAKLTKDMDRLEGLFYNYYLMFRELYPHDFKMVIYSRGIGSRIRKGQEYEQRIGRVHERVSRLLKGENNKRHFFIFFKIYFNNFFFKKTLISF